MFINEIKIINTSDFTFVYLDFSDEVRQGFGSLPDFVPKENDGPPESMLERYKRLKQEVTDLLADMEKLKTVSITYLISFSCIIT